MRFIFSVLLLALVDAASVRAILAAFSLCSGPPQTLSLNETVLPVAQYGEVSAYVEVPAGYYFVNWSGVILPNTMTFSEGSKSTLMMVDNAGKAVLSVMHDSLALPDDLEPRLAVVRVAVISSGPVNVSSRSDECYHCITTPLSRTKLISHSFTLDTAFATTYYFQTGNDTLAVHTHFRPHTSMTVFVYDQCPNSTIPLGYSIATNISAKNPYIPIAVAFAIFAVLAIAYSVYRYAVIQKKQREQSEYFVVDPVEQLSPLVNPPAPAEPVVKKKVRAKSLDTFRGLSLTIMIFVNYGGGGYWFFEHAIWNGLTVADLVFPWFIFMMGCSMALKFQSYAKDATPLSKVMSQVIYRSVVLFLIGLFLNNGFNYHEWRIPGVLQRFGVSYFIVSMIIIFIPPGLTVVKAHGTFLDITPYIWQWVVCLVLIAIWLSFTFGLNVPGCGRGYLGPGGNLTEYGKFQGVEGLCIGGAAGYIDRALLGVHTYQWPTCKELYDTPGFDPEGLLGCLTSAVLTFLGYHTGRILVLYTGHKDRLSRWLLWASFLILLGVSLAGFRKEGGPIPINKNLWSLSFILLLSGMGMLCLSILYTVQDLWGLWGGEPFLFVGMNSILIYIGHELLEGYFPFSWQLDHISHGALFTRNLVGVSLWVFIAYIFYRKKFFFAI